MNIHLVLTSALLCGLLGSCTYSPEEEFQNPVEPPVLENYSISLNNVPDGDTIRLFGPGQFSYFINKGNGVIESVKITLGDRWIDERTELSGSFQINNSNLRTGTWELKIEVITSSGTGSLADKVGAEQIQLWKKWIVEIDVARPPEPVISFATENGYMVVRWPRYTKENFVQYQLEVSYAGVPKRVLTFTDPEINSWVDSSYAGNYNAYYHMYVTNLAGTSDYERSYGVDLDFDLTYKASDSTVTLSLPLPPFYSAFSHYVIKENSVERLSVNDSNDTEATFKLNTVGFRYTSTIRLEMVPKNPAHPVMGVAKTVDNLVHAKRFHLPFERYHYNVDHDLILGFRKMGTSAQLVSLDPLSLYATDSINLYNGPSYTVPYAGDYIYYSHPKEVVQVNLVTHEEKRFHGIRTTYGSGPSQVTASNNQVVSYGWFTDAPSPNIMLYQVVYDMVNDHTIYENNYLYNPSQTSINSNASHIMSPDGAFLFTNNSKIYRVNDGTTQLVGPLSVAGTWIGFRDDQCDEIMSTSGRYVNFYDANTVTLKRWIIAPTVGSKYIGYDVVKRKLIYTNPGIKEIYAVDIATGDAIAFKVILSDFSVLNGILFTPEGEYLKLY